MTISYHVANWLETISAARRLKTHETYHNAINSFVIHLDEIGIKPGSAITRLSEKHIGSFAMMLKEKALSTEKVYLTAARLFYRYLNSEEVASFNMDRVAEIIKTRSRKHHERMPSFPADAIDRMLDSIAKIPLSPTKTARLRDLRDIALVLTLADTGLRIQEACSLKRGDLRDKGGSVIIGKGDKQATIFFSRRSKRAIIQYLRERGELDGGMGLPLADLPVFSRHDKATGKNISAFTPVAGRNAIRKRVVQVLGNDDDGITPHKFRHYFVTAILNETHDLKLAQELARHNNIQMTQRYAHLSENDLEDGHAKAMKGK